MANSFIVNRFYIGKCKNTNIKFLERKRICRAKTLLFNFVDAPCDEITTFQNLKIQLHMFLLFIIEEKILSLCYIISLTQNKNKMTCKKYYLCCCQT